MLRRGKGPARGGFWVHSFYGPRVLQLCLGVVLVFDSSISSETTNETEFPYYWDIGCDSVESLRVYCSIAVTKSIYHIPTIPLDDLNENITHLEAHLSIDGPWMINNHTIFHRFQQLFNLRLVGPVKFPDTYSYYNDEKMKTLLINQLFEPLSSLKVISLWFWNVDDTYNWIFPKELTDLILINCGYTQLDLSYNTNLTLLSIRHNNFTKMPKLSSPPPPLRYLAMSGNHEIEITVYDIVHLCELNALGLTTGFNDNLNDTAQYCECRRLKMYMKVTKIREAEVFECPKVTFSVDCSNYSVDEVLALHNEYCGFPRTTTTPWSAEPELEPNTVGGGGSEEEGWGWEGGEGEGEWYYYYSETSFIPPSDHSKLVCDPCPGCIGVVIGWSFFMFVLFSVVASIAIYVIVSRQLLFF